MLEGTNPPPLPELKAGAAVVQDMKQESTNNDRTITEVRPLDIIHN
jgi:hypothetical protein